MGECWKITSIPATSRFYSSLIERSNNALGDEALLAAMIWTSFTHKCSLTTEHRTVQTNLLPPSADYEDLCSLLMDWQNQMTHVFQLRVITFIHSDFAPKIVCSLKTVPKLTTLKWTMTKNYDCTYKLHTSINCTRNGSKIVTQS